MFNHDDYDPMDGFVKYMLIACAGGAIFVAIIFYAILTS